MKKFIKNAFVYVLTYGTIAVLWIPAYFGHKKSQNLMIILVLMYHDVI